MTRRTRWQLPRALPRGSRRAEPRGPLLEPAFASELRQLLVKAGRPELAQSVERLRLVERCPCDKPHCASFYTAPRFHVLWRWPDETIELDPERGRISVDLINGEIVCVEILDRPPLSAVATLDRRRFSWSSS
jgi:hypothetical protein